MASDDRLPTFEELIAAGANRTQPVVVAVAGGADRSVMEALRVATARGWVVPYFAGRRDAIQTAAENAGYPLDPEKVLDTEAPGHAAVTLLSTGKAQLLMKGQISTPDLLQAMLEPDSGLRTEHVMGQVVLMELVLARRQFLLVDTGVCLQPTLEQKTDLLRSTVQVAHRLGCQRPRVAVLAASEKVTPAMPETQEAAELEALSKTGALGECVVQGPLSFDLAYAKDAAEKKTHPGEVVGAADILLFPNLTAANLTVKAIMYTAECRVGGVLVGARCPVAFMSRADTTATRLHSLALALKLLH